MKKRVRLTPVFGLVFCVVIGGIYGYYRYKFPYGSTHCCSKALAQMLEEYAQTHGGHYPEADDDRQLGLENIMNFSGTQLNLAVGKAGNLAEAEAFYQKNGYLLKEHSSWHYVSGLTTSDTDRALAWDEIPLNHDGMRSSANPREVIFVGGWVKVVHESRWEAFLKEQEQLAKKGQ